MSQLGWWNSQYDGKNNPAMFQTTNQTRLWATILRISLIFSKDSPKNQKYIIIVCIWNILKPPTGMGVVWYGRYGSKNGVPLGVVNGVNAPSRALVFPRNRCGPSLQHLTVTDVHMPKNVKTLYRGRLNAKLMLFPCDHGSSVSNIIGQLFKPKNGGWRLLRTEEKMVLKAEKMMCCKVVFFQMLTCACWYQEFIWIHVTEAYITVNYNILCSFHLIPDSNSKSRMIKNPGPPQGLVP